MRKIFVKKEQVAKISRLLNLEHDLRGFFKSKCGKYQGYKISNNWDFIFLFNN